MYKLQCHNVTIGRVFFAKSSKKYSNQYLVTSHNWVGMSTLVISVAHRRLVLSTVSIFRQTFWGPRQYTDGNPDPDGPKVILHRIDPLWTWREPAPHCIWKTPGVDEGGLQVEGLWWPPAQRPELSTGTCRLLLRVTFYRYISSQLNTSSWHHVKISAFSCMITKINILEFCKCAWFLWANPSIKPWNSQKLKTHSLEQFFMYTSMYINAGNGIHCHIHLLKLHYIVSKSDHSFPCLQTEFTDLMCITISK